MSPEQMAERPSIERSTVDQAIDVAASILCEAIALLDLLGTDEKLVYPSRAISGGTIGKHIRHATDHYNLLLKAVTEGKKDLLSYDDRCRNMPVETSIRIAREALSGLVERLRVTVPTIPLNEPMTLHAVTPFPAAMQTSFGRELWFASLHAIHHWSMIRVIAAEQGVMTDESFGVAPSTLEMRKLNCGVQNLAKAKI